jgi:hypothetical protein
METVRGFVVVKSLTRKYGFTLKAPRVITWAKGPQNTVGWYRRKSDAQKRADELNRAFGLLGLPGIDTG